MECCHVQVAYNYASKHKACEPKSEVDHNESHPPGSEGRFRSDGLRVMSPARSHCATSLKMWRPARVLIPGQQRGEEKIWLRSTTI